MTLDLSDLLGEAEEQGFLNPTRKRTKPKGETAKQYAPRPIVPPMQNWRAESYHLVIYTQDCRNCGSRHEHVGLPMVLFRDLNHPVNTWRTSEPPCVLPTDLPHVVTREETIIPCCESCFDTINMAGVIRPNLEARYPKHSVQRLQEGRDKAKAEQDAKKEATPHDE